MTWASAVQPFDGVASAYDASFTDTLLGRWLRAAVQERLERAFPPGSSVLELGCGTGEDAIWLAKQGVRVTAGDSSPSMLRAAAAKAERAGVTANVEILPLDLRAPDAFEPPAPFDGAFSSFGALNCVGDRRPLVEALGRWVRPGGRVVLVVMGPVCAWETASHLLRGRPRSALRRLRAGAPAHVGAGATTPTWYPSARRLRAELEPWFQHRTTVGIGALLPPSYLGGLVERHRTAFDRLRRLERRLEASLPVRSLADHYVSEFERR